MVGPYYNNFKTLKDALEAVADGGTINVLYNSQPYSFEGVVINKNVNIVGLENPSGLLPTISFKASDYPMLQVNSSQYTNISNINFLTVHGKTLIEAHTPNLILENITTRYCIPLVVKEPVNNSEINILVKNSTFNVFTPEIKLTEPVTGSISFDNNSFFDVSVCITNNGADISFENNTFYNSGILIYPESTGPIDVVDNTFDGNRTAINSASSKDLRIYSSNFSSSFCHIINNDSNNTLNIKYNWWESINGPLGSNNTCSFQGEVDYSSWALDKDCNTFFNDSVAPKEVFVDKNYTIENSDPYVWQYQAFDNIMDAVYRVDDGGTVYIASGEYIETLTINKKLSVVGDVYNPPVISYEGSDVIYITGDDVSLNNLIIDGNNQADNGINAENIDSVSINNVELIRINSNFITLNNVSGAISINQCDITGNSTANGIFIETDGTSSIDIYNTVFSSLDKAVVLEEVYEEQVVSVEIGSTYDPNIFSNLNYYIYLNNFNDNVSALNNIWNLEGIEDKLFHNKDDPSLGKIIYLPQLNISGTAHLKNCYVHEDIKVDLMLNEQLIKTTYTDNDGFFNFNNLNNGTYTLIFHYDNFKTVTEDVYLDCNTFVDTQLTYNIEFVDLNNDSEVSDLDLSLICSCFGLREGDNNWNARYDLNKNGQIDIMDLIIIWRFKGE